MGQLQLPDKEMPAGPLIPTPRPGQYHATGTGDSSSGALSNFRTLPEDRIILKKISSSKHQPARAALYKWENGHKREAPGAGLAVCPATGTGPSQDHTPHGDRSLLAQGRSRCSKALATWLCQPPALSSALQELPPRRGVPVHPLKLWHHTTACHLHLLREAAPWPCQTPPPWPHAPHSMDWGPPCTTLGTPAST